MKINTEAYQQVGGTVPCKCNSIVNHKKRNFFLFLSFSKRSIPSSSGNHSETLNHRIDRISSSGNRSFSAPDHKNCSFVPNSSLASWHR